jgi:6-phosphogluconolactonase
MPDIRIYHDSEQLTRAAALQFVDLARQAIEARGRFSVALSGGSTPKALYTLLASDEFAPRVEWPLVHVFWGDERCVPQDHEDSSYRMARETLLSHVPLPPQNVYRIRGELQPQQAAAEYEQALRGFFSMATWPCFDLVWLGMGEDGHTASLFPHTNALNEQKRWVVENYVASKQTWRVTLSAPAINAAANVVFLVTGAGKAERLRQVVKDAYQPQELPAQMIRPVNGQLVWMVDSEAASRL